MQVDFATIRRDRLNAFYHDLGLEPRKGRDDIKAL
jgi:hypothetical protein